MKKENPDFKLIDAVFERPSIKRILDDGKVSEEEMKEQTELTMKMYEELKATLTEEQADKLAELMKETGVLFMVCLYHNLKRF
ncbi:MAG: hypothetical protein PUD88_00170 [Prevotellaceae bacterium]|nr:hypothetical protein [Prevotella sp.]MDD6816985.1 hypothetical protein [Prevotellaceae bacterium]MDD6843100.1 hypothetical protein [Prevotellaceae bacterium]MDD6977455.1 hypothetical protein [Prevotellaceae bacterium]MDY6199624.1 hypothetical protein [Prevotella sp.]